MTPHNFQLESLAYQNDAVEAVLRVFEGTQRPDAHELAGTHLEVSMLEWLRKKSQGVIVLDGAFESSGEWNLHHLLGDGYVVF